MAWGTVLCVLLAGLMACKQESSPAASGSVPASTEKQGEIKVSGAWALHPLMVRWGEEYMKANPRVKIKVTAGGAGKGVSDALNQATDFGMVSRELKPDEAAQGLVAIAVAKDAVFPVVASTNPVLSALHRKGIKRSALVDLFVSGKALSWTDLTGVATDEKVAAYTRADSCGAGETWAKFLGGQSQEDLKGIKIFGDPMLAQAITRAAGGIGYVNLGAAYTSGGQPIAGLEVIPIDVNGNGKADPEEELSSRGKAIAAVASGVYPAPPARNLYVMAKAGFKGVAKEFVRWCLTDGQKLVDEVGFIKLPPAMLNASIARVR
jgi:phosphate transport system substrate-binding protein